MQRKAGAKITGMAGERSLEDYPCQFGPGVLQVPKLIREKAIAAEKWVEQPTIEEANEIVSSALRMFSRAFAAASLFPVEGAEELRSLRSGQL
jgi:hypothetical protein